MQGREQHEMRNKQTTLLEYYTAVKNNRATATCNNVEKS